MSTRPTPTDALDELAQQLAAELEPGLRQLANELQGTMEQCQQLIEDMPPLPWETP